MMRRSTFVCAVLLALSAPAFAQSSPPAAAPHPAPAPAPTQREQLDELFSRLAAAKDSDETAGIVALIDRLQLQSGSPTSDLLMQRAVATMERGDYSVSLTLLDAIVDLQPDWAEGWNRRATARYLAGDAKGAVADIAQTLARNPRHLGALAGLGMILEDSGQREQALRAYQRALAIAPHWTPVVEAEERVKAALAGQAL
ncbi:MAG TPA: tetratricopeptide repeat protein [Roseiarcus sp.]|jgi:tetratricopeptide (TPR) repeat protein